MLAPEQLVAYLFTKDMVLWIAPKVKISQFLEAD
jgi:hypothetical protein